MGINAAHINPPGTGKSNHGHRGRGNEEGDKGDEDGGKWIRNKNDCGQVNLPCFSERGVGVCWRETAVAGYMVGLPPLALL